MTNSKQTKKALLSSVIALVLCLSMLIGTTFAWFTDSVQSDWNEIKAGNLDIELYHSDKEKKEEKVNGSTVLFDDVTPNLWEPGAMAYETLTVKNEGTLALKYQLSVNFTDATVVNGHSLAEALKVAVVKDGFAEGFDREYLKGLSYNDDLASFTLPGELAPHGSQTYGIVIYWEPTGDDNRFNVKDEALSIKLGVKLLATQKDVDAENDSFGKDYDEDAWMPEMQVYTAQDLQAALNNGETNIKLMDDIVVTDGPIVIPAPAVTTFSLRAIPNTITLDLNGKTISGKVAKSASGVLINEGKLSITGGKIESTETNGGAAIYNKGELALENVTVVGAPSDTATGTASYAVNTDGEGSKLIVNDSNISGRGAIGATNGAKVTLNGGEYHTPNYAWGHAVYAVDEGTEVVINDGVFSEGFEYAAENWGVYQIYSGNKAKVIVNGGTFKEWDCSNGYDLCTATEGTIVINGGTFAENPASQKDINYVAAGYKAVQNIDGSYIVVPSTTQVVKNNDELISAIHNAEDGTDILLATGEYALRFTNNPSFNVDTLTIKGLGNVKLAISSSEVWYGRVQGDNVTFEDICFTGNVGTTGQATYNNCIFDGDWVICASSNQDKTYINNCEIKGCLNTSSDFSAGDTYVKGSTVAKAEYSGKATMCFENCTIGELISWNMNTTLTNCTVEKLDLSEVTDAIIIIDGLQWVADGLYKDPETEANDWYVDNAEGLSNLNAKMLDKSAGQYAEIYLMNDIDFAGKTWKPVDSHADTAFFFSKIDGQGHTIYNLTINGQAMFTRFAGFGNVIIKDLTFDGANVNSNGSINTSVLAVQTYQNVLLDNVDVKNSTISGGYKVAPLIATVYDEKDTSITATLKNCDVSDTTVISTKYDFFTCGLVSFVYVTNNDYVEYENCSVTNVALKAVSGGYNYHANIHYTSADTDDQINEHPQVKVTNVTFESLG